MADGGTSGLAEEVPGSAPATAAGTVTGPAVRAVPATRQQGQARYGVVFAVVCAGIVCVNLDLFIVNVAIPSIGRSFGGANLANLSWVLNAYAIVFAALLVPAGRAADLIGRRAAFLTGMVIFGVASAACAVAPDVWVLVAARVVQAAGGALLMPSSLGLLLAAARPEKRAGTIRAWTWGGGRARPGDRRCPGRRELALGVPRQPPHRRDRRNRGPAGAPASPGRSGPRRAGDRARRGAARHAGRGRVHGRHRRPCPRPRQVRRLGLGLAVDHRPDRGGPRP